MPNRNANSRKTAKIMVFGTFDILHRGHISFFRQARKAAKNPYLIVSVARDINVKKIKGRRPLRDEKYRLRAVKKIKPVDKAVLGGVAGYLSHILRERPDIIALGYDQKAYTQGLKEKLRRKGLIVTIKRLKAYRAKIYKSSKIYGKTQANGSGSSKAAKPGAGRRQR